MSMNLHLACEEEDGEVFDRFGLFQTPTEFTNEMMGEVGVWEVYGKEPILTKYLEWARKSFQYKNDFNEYKQQLEYWFKSRAKYVTNCKFCWYKL